MESGAKRNASIGHVSLEVSDLSEAKRFYETAFKSIGLRVVLEDKDAFGMANENFSIWLATPESRRIQKGAPNPEDFVVAEHFAVLVPDQQTVDMVVETLGRAGFKPFFAPEQHPEFQPGYYSASYCDNDKNVVEFYTT